MKTAIEHDHDVTDIYLFAINSGELYHRHRELIGGRAPLSAWLAHVLGPVNRLYRMQVERNHHFGAAAAFEAARQLRAYYAARIAEERRQ